MTGGDAEDGYAAREPHSEQGQRARKIRSVATTRARVH